MSDPFSPKTPSPFDPPMSPEELEAAEAAQAAESAAERDGALAELEDLKSKVADLTEQSLRAHAEAQNARRRADEEIAKNRKFAIESFAESLLPVLDSLEAGLSVDNATAQQLREGTEATLRQLLSALERNKVQAINPEPGERFDPALQQAISMVPAEQAPNTVVSVSGQLYNEDFGWHITSYGANVGYVRADQLRREIDRLLQA